MGNGNNWALILAGGKGTRLSSLTTTPGGLTIPKQFCSLQGGASLLEEALSRAKAAAHRENIVVVVAEQHRRWWEPPLWLFPKKNVAVQPDNKGTGVGLLLPVIDIVQHDPDATVLVLPSDHFVRDEPVLARAMRQAICVACAKRDDVILLGFKPDHIDPELGYIVPGDGTPLAVAPVRRFVEKPTYEVARELVDAGALWNGFIIAASARALIGLYNHRYAGLVARMTVALEQDRLRSHDASAIHRLYDRMPTLDFSRDLLEGQESKLRVLTVPSCGWSDLGTPHRVAETLHRYGDKHAISRSAPPNSRHLSLADQHSQQQCANCSSVHF